MEFFGLFVAARQETCSGHRIPVCIRWTERIVIIGSTKVAFTLGQEIGFHFPITFFTPRMLHNRVGVMAISVGVRVEG